MNVDDFLNVKPAWHADNFRKPAYGTRYYIDPLPACELAPATDESWPGFSSVKPSKPFRKSVPWVDFDGEVGKRAVPLDLARSLRWMEEAGHPSQVDDIGWRQQFLDSARIIGDRDLMRGNAIHAYAEAYMVGETPPEWVAGVNEALPYVPHVASFIDAHIRRPLHIESVVLSRTKGYGGTGDCWAELTDGRIAYVDWKSRGADSGHGCYEEEVAQGGAYCSADYMIVSSTDRLSAVRAPLPAATVGIVVSIRPDGWEAYEYDLTAAAEAFDSMLAAYRATSEAGKRARAAKKGRPLLGTSIDTGLEQSLRDDLQRRIDAIREADPEAVRRLAVRLQAADIPTLKACDRHTPDQYNRMEQLVTEFEAAVVPFGEPDVAMRTHLALVGAVAADRFSSVPVEVVDLPRFASDEGPLVEPEEYDALKLAFADLDADRRTWVLERAREAQRAGHPVHMAEMASVRRLNINHALIACSSIGDDDVVRELLASVVADEWPLMPAHSLGACFGVLFGDEQVDIATFAEAVAAVIEAGDPLPLADTGRLNLAALAA